MVRAFAHLAMLVTLSSWVEAKQPVTPTPAPARSAPLILGVNVHFGSKVTGSNYAPAATAAAVRASGFTSWRDLLSASRFSLLERGSTEERDILGRFNAFAADASATSAPLLILNSWPKDADPANRLTAFATGVAQALPHYPRTSLFELWNEWDKDTGKTVDSYANLIRTTAPVVRRAAPGASFLIGAAADDQQDLEFRWTRALLARPEAKLADAVSVHVYNHCSVPRRNRAAADMIGRLDRLRAFMVSNRQAKMPIYVSEFGWPTAGKCQVAPDDAAAAMAQFTLLADSRPWIAGIWYYELKDSGTGADDMESHFGLYDYAMRPKPGACAARFVNQLVRRATVLSTYESDDVTAVLLRDGGQVRTVAWATRFDTPATIKVTAKVAQPMCGAPQPVTDGTYLLRGTPVVFNGTNLPLAVRIEGTNTLE